MDISTQFNNVLCIKDVFIMERTDELFISTPLKTPFILDNENVGRGFPFQAKIMAHFNVDAITADEYLQHCMKVFSDRENINKYKKMAHSTLLAACIDEINNNFPINNQRHQSHTNHHNHHSHKPYHVHTSLSTKKKVYNVESDSDDELPLPTTHFSHMNDNGYKGFEYRASADGHA